MLLVDPYLGAAQGNGLENMAHTIISWVAYHILLEIPCGGSKKKKNLSNWQHGMSGLVRVTDLIRGLH